MKKLLMSLMIIGILVTPLMVFAGTDAKPPSSPIYVYTNDDGTRHTDVGIYVAGGTQSNPTLTWQSNINIPNGVGIAGGFFGTQRLAVLPNNPQCLYSSDAGSGDIAAVNLQTQQLVGTFQGSANDSGMSNGIGLVETQNYLYAGYTLSNTIATFSIGSGCALSFLGDITVTPLNGGWVAGMAANGNILVVAYVDGSIQSFNISNGIPVSNNDEQNAAGFAAAYFPDSVDITQDGHFAIFGDDAIQATVEVSDLSSGKLAPTVEYMVGPVSTALGPGLNSATARLSPDETLLYVGGTQSSFVTAAFFNKNTGVVSAGCSSKPLVNFYNPWSYVAWLQTRDTTGTGNVLYIAEFGSSIGIVNVTSTGTACTLTEAADSPVTDSSSPGLLSIQVVPPRPF